KMPADQQEIAYLTGESRELLEHSPYLEVYRARGQDVLLLTDPVDEFTLPALFEYKGKKLRAADSAGPAGDKAAKPEADEALRKLFAHLKAKLEEVGDVRASSRLKESAACLVAEEGAPSAHLERLMQRLGRGGELGKSKRVLE